jgi:EPS-associated MarR family transcriptional regulator
MNTRSNPLTEIHHEEISLKIMRLLQDNPDLTQRELAEALNVSVGRLNYCLKALAEKGWVKVQNFSQSKSKFKYVYLLTPTGIAQKAALTHRFLQRKLNEYQALRAEIEALKTEAASHTSTQSDLLRP